MHAPLAAWRYRLGGIAYWSYAAVYGDYWDDFDLGLPDWAQVYPDPTGRLVLSKRWAAWREGVEHFLVLQLYEDELHSRGEPRLGEETLLQEDQQVADLEQAPVEFMGVLMDKIVLWLLEYRGENVTQAKGKRLWFVNRFLVTKNKTTTTLREEFVKITPKVAWHLKHVTFQWAKVPVTRN